VRTMRATVQPRFCRFFESLARRLHLRRRRLCSRPNERRADRTEDPRSTATYTLWVADRTAR
jgi:hypothetical protein